MPKKSKFLGIIIIMLFFQSCIYFTTRRVQVQKDTDGEWRIYDMADRNQGRMSIDPNHRIHKVRWKATGSDMDFYFPENMKVYFNFDDGLFDPIEPNFMGPDGANEARRVQRIQEGETLTLEVRRDAPTDTIDYDIRAIDDSKFIIGNSPPYLMIRPTTRSQ